MSRDSIRVVVEDAVIVKGDGGWSEDVLVEITDNGIRLSLSEAIEIDIILPFDALMRAEAAWNALQGGAR